jgi:hypothetical protein
MVSAGDSSAGRQGTSELNIPLLCDPIRRLGDQENGKSGELCGRMSSKFLQTVTAVIFSASPEQSGDRYEIRLPECSGTF